MNAGTWNKEAKKLLQGLQKAPLIARVRSSLESVFRRSLFHLSPLLLVEYLYFKQRGRFYDPRHSRAFDEKLLWLMLYWRHPLKSRCADKYAVRSYVAENGLAHILTPLYGVYADSGEIDFSKLPERFVLKCTHGCGFNIYCTGRKALDQGAARRTLDQWMKMDISKSCGELHYASIRPRIICEAYLGDSSGNLPTDYKVYCFDGKAHCTMACTDRYKGTAHYDFYDRDWKHKLPYSRTSLMAKRDIPRPIGYERMISAAEKLSQPFPFVRVDLYSIEGKVLFGEMTFTPKACIDTGYTEMAQDVMGDLIQLPQNYSGRVG